MEWYTRSILKKTMNPPCLGSGRCAVTVSQPEATVATRRRYARKTMKLLQCLIPILAYISSSEFIQFWPFYFPRSRADWQSYEEVPCSRQFAEEDHPAVSQSADGCMSDE